jgi:hypothetical protein
MMIDLSKGGEYEKGQEKSMDEGPKISSGRHTNWFLDRANSNSLFHTSLLKIGLSQLRGKVASLFKNSIAYCAWRVNMATERMTNLLIGNLLLGIFNLIMLIVNVVTRI